MNKRKMVVAVLLLALLVLHQDYWQWHRSDLVFGFVPYALAWHMGVSLATAIVWIFTVSVCWAEPVGGVDDSANDRGSGGHQ